MQAFAFSLGMEVEAASLQNEGPLDLLSLMCQVFILSPLTSAKVNK